MDTRDSRNEPAGKALLSVLVPCSFLLTSRIGDSTPRYSMAKAAAITKALKTIDRELQTIRQRRVEAVLRPFHRERRKLQVRIEKINQLIARALGKLDRGATTVEAMAAKPVGKKKRVRRSSEKLKKIASKVVEFVKSKGKDGVTPGAIKSAFGNLAPSPLQFVKKHIGIQLQRKGHAKRPTYFYS